MLRSLKDLERYRVFATDGDIGSVVDFLVDDEHWTVRYLIVETGGPLSTGQRVLVSPVSFARAEWTDRHFHLALTGQKVRNSPSVELDKPVSRQHEIDYYSYYGYPAYWDYGATIGLGTYPGMVMGGLVAPPPRAQSDKTSRDVHLRSVNEVRGYHIHGTDESIGHVADFVVDDETWKVRYLVIDTSNWWMGKKVLIAPEWARDVSWENHVVNVDLTREVISNSPEWNPTAVISSEYENELREHYQRQIHSSSTSIPTTTSTKGAPIIRT